jgi:hypothetical protein
MKSLPKRLSRFAAITCIGLAGSAFAVFAQTPAAPGGPAATKGPVTPPSFKCGAGEMGFKVGNGTDDHFVTTGVQDLLPHPDPAFKTTAQLMATNIYDQTASNYHFGDSFKLQQPGGAITKFRVTTRVKSNSTDSNNDGFSFSTVLNFTPGHFSYGFAQGVGPIGWGDLTFDFDQSLPSINVYPVAAATPGGYNNNNFFSDLNTGHSLHIYVQDDTSVDFIGIEGCYKKYDLVASKKHDGNVYILHMHNAGPQIPSPGKVDVVEVVPAGLTITSFPGAPWSCNAGPAPVVGPDSFTCSYQIPTGGIAANSDLPQIVLKSEGSTGECQNCMRVKLYLGDGVKPVDEGDMKNNVSCTK